jgi:hypothetical protein
MRIRSSVFPFLCIAIFSPLLSRAYGDDASSPPGYVWYALEHFGGRVLIPTGWFCRGIRVPSGFGYEITEDEVASKSADNQNGASNKHTLADLNRLSIFSDYRTGFTIKVISGPFWNKSSLSKLADGLIEDRKREGRMSALLDSPVGTYWSRSFDRESVEAVGNVIETKHFVELILQDTETPTLVFVTFDCPLSAWPKNKDHCERFFAALSLFQDAQQATHSPYSPHAPTTKAAAEAVAQAVAADRDPIGKQQSAPDGTVIRIRRPQ